MVFQVCLVLFCQLDTTRVIWDEGIKIEKMHPSDWLVGSLRGNFLIND